MCIEFFSKSAAVNYFSLIKPSQSELKEVANMDRVKLDILSPELNWTQQKLVLFKSIIFTCVLCGFQEDGIFQMRFYTDNSFSFTCSSVHPYSYFSPFKGLTDIHLPLKYYAPCELFGELCEKSNRSRFTASLENTNLCAAAQEMGNSRFIPRIAKFFRISQWMVHAIDETIFGNSFNCKNIVYISS